MIPVKNNFKEKSQTLSCLLHVIQHDKHIYIIYYASHLTTTLYMSYSYSFRFAEKANVVRQYIHQVMETGFKDMPFDY